MAQAAEQKAITSTEFQDNFGAIAPLILAEWPTLNAESLQATNGDWEDVVAYVAQQTEHTRTLIRRQLQELAQLAHPDHTPPKSSRLSAKFAQLANKTLAESDLKETVELLETRTEELLEQFKQDVLPELNQKVRNNVGGSLLTALGIGFVLGILLGGGRGR